MKTIKRKIIHPEDTLHIFNIKKVSFHPFPEEFGLASTGDETRKQIDDEFIKILNLDINLKSYFEMLINEPVLTLRRL
ncbi:unnamed protein product [marine sediment metagenome]|uniref:Uncharacterized protein n=1 Tax=marine sediment metagenome TaxID=412755 RepID=X0ZXQ3_9ZZZZ